jgi:serine/threonine-protein kinase
MMTDPDDATSLVGAVLNRRWRVSALIGEGGLGRVFEVLPIEGGAPYAAKLLREEFCQDPEIVARFLAEAEAARRVPHPGALRALESGVAEDGTPYLLLERLVGETLGALLERGRLPVNEACRITREVLVVLGSAHAVGVLHRDLKPDNVFLESASDGPRVRVLDFGLALVMDAAGGLNRRTRTGMLLGTPGYLSPEQVRDAKRVGPAADLWAVGVMLYEMLTGAQAFPAQNEFERITRMLTQDPVPVAQIAPQYAHWSEFFARAFAREPAARYSSATEMIEALDQAGRGLPSLRPPARGSTHVIPSVSPPRSSEPAPPTAPIPLVPRAGFDSVRPAPRGEPKQGATKGPDTAISAGVPGYSPEGRPDLVSMAPPRVRAYSLTWLLCAALVAWFIGALMGFGFGRL